MTEPPSPASRNYREVIRVTVPFKGRTIAGCPFSKPYHHLPRRNPDIAAGEMAEVAGTGASFPIVFFDGKTEIDIGAVAVHPAMGFKKFQAVVSQKIGVAPHQISTSLVRRKKARASPEVRRRVPIDEASDFGALAGERDCFVLAALRRSRRDRRGGRGKRGGGGREIEKNPPAVSAPEKTILRRNAPAIGGVLMPESAAGMLGLWDYESQLRNLQRQRDQYLMATSCYPYAAAAPPGDGFLVGDGRRAAAQPPAAECGECLAAATEGRATAFHWCVYDAVTVGFRSPVGPIQRPPRKAAELEG